MQTYETVIVLHPRFSDEDVAKFVDNIKQMIGKGGDIVSEDRWGRRKLAYPIRHSREGYYIYFKYHAAGSLVGELAKYFRLQETILRTLTVHAEEPKKNGGKKNVSAAKAAVKTAVPAEK